MGILETKLTEDKLMEMMNRKARTWEQLNNFETHRGGRIAVIWNPKKIQVHWAQKSPQAVHCIGKCNVIGKKFLVSFIYGFNSLVGRRELWKDLIQTGNNQPMPWVVLGDFNCVLCAEEKRNVVPPTVYKMKDIRDCFQEAGLVDMNLEGNFLTWSNGMVWCKWDRVMMNQRWIMEGSKVMADFQLPGILSDHSVCQENLFAEQNLGKAPFKFFNMWMNHVDFQNSVVEIWARQYESNNQYRLTRKLKDLKLPLKALNMLHLSHILSRVEKASAEVVEIQEKLQNSPSCQVLQGIYVVKKREAVMLKEANRQFLAQVAKYRYFKNYDRGTSYFHAILKRNRARNHITSVTKQNGVVTESYEQVGIEFVQYYQHLLGEEVRCDKLDDQVISRGPFVNKEERQQMIVPVTDEEIREALFSIGDEKSPGLDGYSVGFFKKA
ncbi:uncharacterized protein LOC131145824 [Malania oleifera]|uniref:uncharacterized protein LOC131145824 n=1 Tax=Malania oleifera TaxID=397392 RepID=UPI0025AE2D1B|nr:uncharacterized protein LOC131145824 [Malania oleifera]